MINVPYGKFFEQFFKFKKLNKNLLTTPTAPNKNIAKKSYLLYFIVKAKTSAVNITKIKIFMIIIEKLLIFCDKFKAIFQIILF